MKLSGVSDSVKTNGEAAVPSIPVKPVAQTGVSSGDVNSMKSKGVAAVSSSQIKPIGKIGASSGLNIGEMITFKDVTFGPHEGEVRFQLIHFWEAWNAQTKVLIGLEMLLIDEEVDMHVVIVPVESSSGAFTVCNGGGSLLSMEGRRESWRDGGDESRLLGPKRGLLFGSGGDAWQSPSTMELSTEGEGPCW
ncbi:hypothetical protein DY000_02008543 [Brassica cretica]|uniref:Uncharacterized protein n=1 Tax=Brassica cretica TaxID=69181 RepID=A0ABQ7BV61_BRACR|nr:hypothetical protein DY000_02008543 [Brassica cretica]